MTHEKHTGAELLAIAAIAVMAVALSGCSPRATITVDGKKAAFDADMTPTAEKTVRRFTGAEGSLYNKEEIRKSLAGGGIKVDSVAFPKPSSISLGLTLPEVDGLLEKAVSCSEKNRTLTLTISGESIHAALALMPRSTNEYLDLLMAPVFSGEKLTTDEYIDIIGAAYGKTLADELEKSEFTLTVRCPSPVTAVRIDTPATCASEGKQAVFRIPLASLLTMERPFSARAEW